MNAMQAAGTWQEMPQGTREGGVVTVPADLQYTDAKHFTVMGSGDRGCVPGAIAACGIAMFGKRFHVRSAHTVERVYGREQAEAAPAAEAAPGADASSSAHTRSSEYRGESK